MHKAIRVPKEPQVPRVLLGHKARRALRVKRGLKDLRVLKEHQARRVQLVLIQLLLDRKEPQVRRVIRVLRAQ